MPGGRNLNQTASKFIQRLKPKQKRLFYRKLSCLFYRHTKNYYERRCLKFFAKRQARSEANKLGHLLIYLIKYKQRKLKNTCVYINFMLANLRFIASNFMLYFTFCVAYRKEYRENES